MKNLAKRVFQKIWNTLRLTFIGSIIIGFRREKEVREWEKSGKPVPLPYRIKEKTIKDYANQHSLQIFVETGTYLGDMVNAVKDHFRRIYSIELDSKLFESARKRFSKERKIEIIQGDSAKMLPLILKQVQEPCLFWLDGHFSGGITAKGNEETPIIDELSHILSHPVEGHVILIDDARLFMNQNGYPDSKVLQALVASKRSGWKFEIKEDIIRIHG